MEDILPYYLSIGVSFERFMDSTPNELKPFSDADKLIYKRTDQHLYDAGLYVMRGVAVAIDHCLNGKKAESKYYEKPFYEEMRAAEQCKELTEEEKRREVDLFFAQEKARRVNWNRNHRKDGSAS